MLFLTMLSNQQFVCHIVQSKFQEFTFHYCAFLLFHQLLLEVFLFLQVDFFCVNSLLRFKFRFRIFTFLSFLVLRHVILAVIYDLQFFHLNFSTDLLLPKFLTHAILTKINALYFLNLIFSINLLLLVFPKRVILINLVTILMFHQDFSINLLYAKFLKQFALVIICVTN